MRLFGCGACKAKDDEIQWLRYELQTVRRGEAETRKPGITRTIEPNLDEAAKAAAARAVPASPPKPRPPTMPGYEPFEPPEVEVT